jgi:hypothetical protein
MNIEQYQHGLCTHINDRLQTKAKTNAVIS